MMTQNSWSQRIAALLIVTFGLACAPSWVWADDLHHFWRNNDADGRPWRKGDVIDTGYANAVSMIQGTLGDQGNFELVAAYYDGSRREYVLRHFWRNNDASHRPWRKGGIIDEGYVYSASLIQSNFGSQGNFELVVARYDETRGEDVLQHYWRDNDADGRPWRKGTVIAAGYFTSVSLIQSTFGSQGNFELVAAGYDEQRGDYVLKHFWRNNDADGRPWRAGRVIATGYFNDASLIQGNFGSQGNFELVAAGYDAEQGEDVLRHYWRNNDADDRPWRAGRVIARGYFSDISLIQGTFGSQGNFELVAIGYNAQRGEDVLRHYWRNNDADGRPWRAGRVIATDYYSDVTLIQGTFGDQGNFELVASQ